ncbi:hypothetical protein ASPBRDRAFT_211167 [Aspergillus brasiliensis CBS 101740]|uniref:Uncharacterized protein n=1 Tax=Aspergillus brasiliensis (strain CBS 101740 / IMI 381727 / IBT 21946) TaxID=767769 RepID=A0A1L9U5L5_ASPBC|nr:hypothetical protein ASPBRDRAFT_211167 [Aspergillus brasiliensis CBS 101740]
MVFHAYAKNCNDDWSWRYLITAPDYNTFNDWFETVRAKVGDRVIYKLSSDFIAYDRNKFALGDCTRQNQEASKFLDKIMITLLNDRDGRTISTFNNSWNTSA